MGLSFGYIASSKGQKHGGSKTELYTEILSHIVITFISCINRNILNLVKPDVIICATKWQMVILVMEFHATINKLDLGR